MLRRVILAGLSTCLLALAFSFSQSSNAHAQAAVSSSGNCPYWIDSATGIRVRTLPQALPEWEFSTSRGKTRVSGSGRNFNSPDGGQTWIDSATGQPASTLPQGLPEWEFSTSRGKTRVSGSGHNYLLVPCPPPTQTSGLYLGGGLLKNSGRVGTTETSATTGAVTNQFSDSGDPLGGGIVAGYNFAPWNNNIVLGPFISIDWLKQTINHTFAGGTFLGTTTHWIINAGVKAGVVTSPGVYIYGLAGAAWLNQDLNVNFATAASSNVTTPGFTLGLGGEYQPSSWRLFGKPVSVFAQYQHTWWSTANFNMPTSSPGFNYAFKRTDDTIKLGVNVYLSP